VVEQSHQSQLYRLLRMFVEVPARVRPLCRSGANPITVQEVLAAARAQALSLQRQPELEAEPALD